ncbi:MAG: hypothetical protein MUO35_15000 [Anaerolineales bacterium]|nr:hypothetical protein [Anaerolineales bacterium]
MPEREAGLRQAGFGLVPRASREMEAVQEPVVDQPILLAGVHDGDLIQLPVMDEVEAVVIVGLRAPRVFEARVDGGLAADRARAEHLAR